MIPIIVYESKGVKGKVKNQKITSMSKCKEVILTLLTYFVQDNDTFRYIKECYNEVKLIFTADKF